MTASAQLRSPGAARALPLLPEFPELATPEPRAAATSPGSPAAGASSAASKAGKLKRQHTNVEPLGAMSATCFGSQRTSSPSGGFLMLPTLSLPKRPRDTDQQLPSVVLHASADKPEGTPRPLGRQLTPRISWSSLLGDASEDVLMCGDSQGSQASRLTGHVTPRKPGPAASPPSSPCAGARHSSPPPRPEKLRGLALRRAPPTPGGGFAPVDAWEGGNRFTEDFEDARVIGSGSFAVVYRARNRIDKQEYAIKKTKKTLGRSGIRQELLQEALALASVAIHSPCPYIVRYFASWVEDERLFIQTELCDGSLKDAMLSLRQQKPHDPRLDEEQLSAVIRDVCMGLSVLHSKNLVHLDVKPENILVKHLLPTSSREGSSTSKIHKIADLGLATAAMGSGCDEINEGDSRYLAREVLQGNFSDLTKADVFSLGLTCYELATNPKELPVNGDEWHRLRDGMIEEGFANHLSSTMLSLVRSMIHPVAAERPPCVEVPISLSRPGGIQAEVDMYVQELQCQLRLQTEAAEREQRRRASAEEKADRYWSELLHMKRQALMAPNETTQTIPEAVVIASVASPARTYKRSFTQ